MQPAASAHSRPFQCPSPLPPRLQEQSNRIGYHADKDHVSGQESYSKSNMKQINVPDFTNLLLNEISLLQEVLCKVI